MRVTGLPMFALFDDPQSPKSPPAGTPLEPVARPRAEETAYNPPAGARGWVPRWAARGFAGA